MESTKRQLIGQAAAAVAGVLTPAVVRAGTLANWYVPEILQKSMYDSALRIARNKIRGGPGDPNFAKPFTDAAFSSNIFYWDTCLIATYAKYHFDTLPIVNALDNFYRFQDSDGFICREYTKEGKPFWSKDHPVGTNPPLLAFAELQVYSASSDKARLAAVYPTLQRHLEWLVNAFRMPDGLFISDGLGSGMDSIPRYPKGWRDDGRGIPLVQLFPQLFSYKSLSASWNRQGRSVDMSAQMAFFARNMVMIAGLVGQADDIAAYRTLHHSVGKAINEHCWNEDDGCYYDLGYGKHVRRKHVGMFWTLVADVVPQRRLPRLLGHLTSSKEFWRLCPVATLSADDEHFNGRGGYWLGGVWAPTNYMTIMGLERVGRHDLACRLARQYYWCVAQVFENTGTFWENYAPDSIERGNPSAADFCGWTALVPIALWHEYIKEGAKVVPS